MECRLSRLPAVLLLLPPPLLLLLLLLQLHTITATGFSRDSYTHRRTDRQLCRSAEMRSCDRFATRLDARITICRVGQSLGFTNDPQIREANSLVSRNARYKSGAFKREMKSKDWQ